MEDWLKYYDDETYLIEEVGRRFRDVGVLDAADFWMILIWKADRAKNYHLKRLEAKSKSGFAEAVSMIANELTSSVEGKDRLQCLIKEWGFSLPTATAILTLLYPEEFAVYDWRVCDELLRSGQKDYKRLANRAFSESLWIDYQGFLTAVKNVTPTHLSLRNKDRYLTGKSYRTEITDLFNAHLE